MNGCLRVPIDLRLQDKSLFHVCCCVIAFTQHLLYERVITTEHTKTLDSVKPTNSTNLATADSRWCREHVQLNCAKRPWHKRKNVAPVLAHP